MRKLPPGVHELRGNPGKRRHLPGIQPEIPEKAPDPPAFLSPAAAGEWRRLGQELHRLGLLTGLDVAPFGAYCESYATWITAMQAATGATEGERRILAGIERDAAKDMLRFGRAFGLTPASRAGVVGGTRLEASKFDGLIV